MSDLVDAWRTRGGLRTVDSERVFVVDVPPAGVPRAAPLLVLHGFPTSSFDFHQVVDRMALGLRLGDPNDEVMGAVACQGICA